jgi:predicted AAA+ superfamily ATPase
MEFENALFSAPGVVNTAHPLASFIDDIFRQQSMVSGLEYLDQFKHYQYVEIGEKYGIDYMKAAMQRNTTILFEPEKETQERIKKADEDLARIEKEFSEKYPTFPEKHTKAVKDTEVLTKQHFADEIQLRLNKSNIQLQEVAALDDNKNQLSKKEAELVEAILDESVFEYASKVAGKINFGDRDSPAYSVQGLQYLTELKNETQRGK